MHKICYKFRDGKCEKGKDCPYKHVKDTSRSGTPKKKGKGSGRSAADPAGVVANRLLNLSLS